MARPPNNIDLTGQRFGGLVVIHKALGRYDARQATTRWVAGCDCGQAVVVSTWNLKHQKTCGCVNANANPDLASVPRVVRDRLRNIKARGLRRRGWSLNDNDAIALLLSKCEYCGNQGTAARPNGLDRIDSLRGYETGNVVACCGQCNCMKLDYSVAEFKAQVARIAKWQP